MPAAEDPIIEERRARARARSVLVCTPIARAATWEYTRALASTALYLPEQGIQMGFQFVVGGSIVSKARNELVAHFLASKMSDLLFVDDDIDFSPADVVRLLGSRQPLIAGVGRMRVQKPNSDPAVWCCRFMPGTDLIQDDMGAIEVLGAGTAFMLVNRSVFYRMIDAHPEWKRPGAHDWPAEIRANYFEFFRQNHEGDAADVSEDYVFCDRWRKLGGQVFVDPEIALGHVGSWNYRGSVAEVLKPIEESNREAA